MRPSDNDILDDTVPRAFVKPPLDGSLNVLDIIEQHGHRSPTHPLFKYVDAADKVVTITWADAVKAFNAATLYVEENTRETVKSRSTPLVVGILANLDSVTYATLIVGIMNAGYTPFPISPRNSPEGVAHLLSVTECSVLYVSDDLPIQKLLASSFNHFQKNNPATRPITSLKAPVFDDLYAKQALSLHTDTMPSFRKVLDQTAPCVIIHSSGTVSFPKPITITYRMFFEHALMLGLEGDFCGEVVSVHATPMYHLMGLRSIAYSAVLGIALSVFRPSNPAIVASPDAVLTSSVATGASRISCPPSFLESWALDHSDVQRLKTFKWVMYGGGPLDATVGDNLAREGVKLMPTLGLTEVGPITSYIPKQKKSTEWSWLTFSPFLDLQFIKEDGYKDDVYRMIIKRNLFKTPSVTNVMIGGVPAYDTSDLYVRHPTEPDLWKIVGRADDQIMHSTGEKTNPIPIEAELEKSPLISKAIVFGRARFRPGVVIFPSEDQVFSPEDVDRKDKYIARIWSTVSATNQSSPQHSRIFKEMILIADPNKPYEVSSIKGVVRRTTTLDRYKEEIDTLYDSVEGENGGKPKVILDSSRRIDYAEIRTHIKECVENVLGEDLRDEDDIFRAGADSLCTVSIRNAIIQRLKGLALMDEASIQNLPRDLLYILPSISQMSAFIYGAIRFSQSKKALVPDTPAAVQKPPKGSGFDADMQWQKILQSKETVTELSKGDGIPLILLHGGSGTLHTFHSFTRCTTAVWGVQVTPETPVDSVESWARHYFQKIKERRPVGPYRLASYSGSCVLILELILLFQRAGDRVIQFSMLDHFPIYYFPSLNADEVELDDPKWFQGHLKQSLEEMMETIANTSGEMGARAAQRYKELKIAFSGGPVAPTIKNLIETSTPLIWTALEYMLKERFMVEVVEDGVSRKRWSPARFREFTSGIIHPLTVYVAKTGIRSKTPPHLMDQAYEDLGARQFFPNARVKYFEGGHLDFLYDDVLLRSVETDFEAA